tara:strand:- start:169 stop:390 length:222 start_codon:yes stop_codon:yes gene_type:complete
MKNLNEDDFIHKYIESILDVPGDLSSGVNGCISKIAYGRVCRILEANGAPKPQIVHVIRDPEVETTYIVENGR